MSRAKEFHRGSTKGYLHEPESATGEGILLTHGAGGNCRSPLLVAVAEALARAGMWVLRYDLPFRQQRAFGPPRGNGADDRRGLSEAVQQVRALVPGTVYLGGHSYGGRQASILAVEEPGVCDGLVLLSYPLHPPKQPHKLRTSHFGQLSHPALFVHGTKDPFGSPEELRAATQLIPGRTAVALVENAGHDLLKGNFDVSEYVVDFFRGSAFSLRSASQAPRT